jgi:hypothetical protein
VAKPGSKPQKTLADEDAGLSDDDEVSSDVEEESFD